MANFNRTTSIQKSSILILGCSLLLSFNGCQSVEKFKWPSHSMAKASPSSTGANAASSMNPLKMINPGAEKSPAKTPTRMVVIWKDATISDAAKPPTRGFGGRVYFYDEKEQTVQVDGEMIVFGYEDGENEGSIKADRKYVFLQEEFQKRFSETDLGPSYSIWLPWDRAGGERQTIALLPVFKANDGTVVQGGHSVCVLNGTPPQQEAIAKVDVSGNHNQTANAKANSTNFSAAQVSHMEAGQPREGRLNTTTIRVPRETARRMHNANERQPLDPQRSAMPIGMPSNQANSIGFSPLVDQLHSRNRLENGETVSYGEAYSQPTNHAAMTTRPNEVLTSSVSTPEATPAIRRSSSPERKPVFGQPGIFR